MSINTSKSDLWKAFQRGDEEAYSELYRTHIKHMYRYGMSLVPVSEAFVLDCIHDVFMEIWMKRDRITEPDNIKFYLLKALKVRILHLFARTERPYESFHDSSFNELWEEPSTEEIFSQQEETVNRKEFVENLISKLPPRQQEAIRLRFIEELDYDQIGVLLSINHQSAKNLIFRAIENMRGWLLSAFVIFSSFF
ncbi:RNA polymerase sigma factor [Dyadobacter sp. CY323]|uniref:RNA polymerase sigma factor n=1 Tax=Dyadobacter sp. CY323 TaxID=2907302 RepID=UPI001F35F9F7|nr:sigma-70 family RNA polymerase sigma factor [Dyadobacter sp. CY323]MCE6991092.1 sigma-70 family RNA polymerase sigma factor [Dyadobacter sp. CY323]